MDENYPDLKKLVENMYETMYESDGVGLAAPQIGLPIRLIVIDADVLEDPDQMDKLINRQAELQDKLDAADAWNIDNKLERAMDALRCPPEDQNVATLSGGERRRVALCRLLLQNPDITETERTQYVQSITSATKRLTELINNILKLNKLENQRIFPEFSTVNLTESLCESILLFEKDWDEKNIDLQTDIPDGLFIRADGELLSLVWSNLLSNALKFTPDGGTISVRAVDYKKSTIVTIADNGCGIPEEALPHIFEKFYQGDKSRSSQGNGLGLALVKRIADIHGGTVRVSSVCEKDKPDGGADKPEKLNISVPATPTHGTTFTVILPKN